MRSLPVYSFQNASSTGIDEVPLDSKILVIDSDGIGTAKEIILIDKTGITGSTTIGTLLTTMGSQYTTLATVPSGAIFSFPTTSAPSGFLECDGSALSRTAYASLFAVLGTTYGVGDGSTTFNIPDLRGEFIRGLDSGRGIDSGRAIGSAQGDAIRNITGSTTQKTVITYLDTANSTYVTGAMTATGHQQTASAINNSGTAGDKAYDIGIDASKVVPTASENRPRNIAMLYCIKY